MLVRDGEDYFEITVAERLTDGPGVGDSRFAVRVRVSGRHAAFSAESECWVARDDLTIFADQLRTLEQRRSGSASLESMSPGELRLEIRTTDRAGHVVAEGQIGREFAVVSTEPYWSAVAFRLRFCPTELPALVREFSSLVGEEKPGHGETQL